MNAYIGFGVGVATGVAANALTPIVLSLWYKATQPFSLTGSWYARFTPPTPVGSTTIEVVTLYQSKEDVVLYVENYNSARSRVTIYRGRGVYRASQVAGHYRAVNSLHPALGAFSLRCCDTDSGGCALIGQYVQIHDRLTIPEVRHANEAYELRTLTLGIKRRIRSVVRRSYFASYAEAEQWVDQHGDSDPLKTEAQPCNRAYR